MEKYLSNIRHNVKKLRSMKKASLEVLSEKSNSTAKTISNLEKEGSDFKMSTFIKVAQALDIDPCYLLVDTISGDSPLLPFNYTVDNISEHQMPQYSILYSISDPSLNWDEVRGSDCRYEKVLYTPRSNYGFSNYYGINAFIKYDRIQKKPLMTFWEITKSEAAIDALIHKLNICETPPSQLFEILDDFYCSIYSQVKYF